MPDKPILAGLAVFLISCVDQYCGNEPSWILQVRHAWKAEGWAVKDEGNGAHHLCIYTEETSKLNIGVKLGSKHIYNLFGAGIEPRGDSTVWYTSLGLGGHIPLDPFFVDIDGAALQPRSVPWWVPDRLSVVTKLRIAGGLRIVPGLAIVAGPTLSLQITDREPGNLVPYYRYRLLDQYTRKVFIRSWPGFTAGIQLF